VTRVRSWEELLDRLEEELEGATPPEPFLPPTALGPIPAELVERARGLQDALAAAEQELLVAMVTVRQELALLPAPPAAHAQFVDTLA
jgi:hypothetical protein